MLLQPYFPAFELSSVSNTKLYVPSIVKLPTYSARTVLSDEIVVGIIGSETYSSQIVASEMIMLSIVQLNWGREPDRMAAVFCGAIMCV